MHCNDQQTLIRDANRRWASGRVGVLALVLAAGAALAQQQEIRPEDRRPGSDPDEVLAQQQVPGQAQDRALAQAPQGEIDALAVPSLFIPVPQPAGATPHRQSRAHISAIPDLALLGSAEVGTQMLLNVGPGADLRMTVTQVDRRPDGTYSIRGTLDRLTGTSVMMAVQEDALACDISAPPLGLHYKTRYVANGVHLVCDIDDGQYASCGGTPVDDGSVPEVEEDVPERWEPDLQGQPFDRHNPPFSTRGSCAPTVVFDAMIVYSSNARIAAGSTSAMQAEIQLAIDRTNESYENSPVSARMRLVSRYEVSYDDVGTYNNHLDRLTGTNGQGGSGIWPGIRTNRDTLNADFCTLFVSDGEACGLAWCTSGTTRAYSVVDWSCAAGNLSHPHEIGHNQGCAHDPDNDDGGCAAETYSFGHRFFGTDGVQYRTVMAYAPGTRIPYFSNPNQTYQGTATGTTTRRNEDTIEGRKDTCEAFELTRWDIFADVSYPNFPVPGIGTNDFPYSSLATAITAVDDYVSGASEYPNLYLKSSFVAYTGTISKEMTILPCGGSKTIGQ